MIDFIHHEEAERMLGNEAEVERSTQREKMLAKKVGSKQESKHDMKKKPTVSLH